LALRCDGYVTDFELAAEQTLVRLMHEDGFYDAFVREMSVSGDKSPYPNFAQPFAATVAMMREVAGDVSSGICVGVTHDWLVNVATAYATGKVVTRADGDYASNRS